MSPAKRRLLASDMSSLQRSIRSDFEKTPRSNGVRVVDEDDGGGGDGRMDEDDVQKEWEGKSPARRLFVDDGGEQSTTSPRRHTPRTTPLFQQSITGFNTTSSPGHLAASPPISERGTPPPPSTNSRRLGSPTTPRPTKKPRLPISRCPSTTTTTTTDNTEKNMASRPSTPPKISNTSHSHPTTPRSSTKKRLNLLSDVEDDLFSPFKTDIDRRGDSSRSRSRPLSVSNIDESSNSRTDENADPNACGFMIWNDDDDANGNGNGHGNEGHQNSTDGMEMNEDEVDSGRFLRGMTYPTLMRQPGTTLEPSTGIATPSTISSGSSIQHDDEEFLGLVEQENKPPSTTWMERKVGVAVEVEVEVVETLVVGTGTTGRSEGNWEMMALSVGVSERDEDVVMV